MTAPDDYKNGMRRLAGGVSIVTAAGKDGWRGLTATAVTSLSADPPSMLVCVNSQLEAATAIRDAGAFGINVLRQNHIDIARMFAGMEGATGPEKFKCGTWQETTAGVLILQDALVGFECRLFETLETSTHTVFMGQVEHIHLGLDGRPLVYSEGKFATLAA